MLTPPDEILTSFHKDLLKFLAASPIGPRFFLTGGTALSAFYLQHRLSEDLDLFTEEPGAVAQAAPVLLSFPKNLVADVRIARQFTAFLEVFVTSPSGENVKMDFAQDSPYRLQPIREFAGGLRVDNALDISCNKLSALFGRADAKDFVDIYFIVEKLFPFESLLADAKKKHVGLDNYWLAMAFQQVEKISKWPTMKKPCNFDDLRQFFLTHARQLLQ